ncbi:hypothetical protein V5O48_017121 [Marasmius crinis-equi]|uniref:Uncharacterized protein n=1 Tax=Marasmius crinis-equi TaxID=585013 RepID=A0ABR3EPV2_9AGAR
MASVSMTVPIPWWEVDRPVDSILLSSRFVQLLIDADLPASVTSETYDLVVTEEDDGNRWSQYCYDIAELDRPNNDYCPMDQITRGVFVNEHNFVEWVRGNTTTTNVGFVYSGEAKLSFCTAYDYELPLPTLLGDELVTLPFVVRVWRRDSFISNRDVRFYVQNSCRDAFVPARYRSDLSPFTPQDFYRLCKPFGLGDDFALAHLDTGFDLVMGSAARTYENMVTVIAPHLGFTPLDMSVAEFDDIIRLNLGKYTIDGEVFAEYWLTRMCKALEFKKNQILAATERSRGRAHRFYPL